MTLIDDFVAKVEGAPILSGNSLTLAQTDFNSDFADAFFANVVGGDSFTVREARRQVGSGTVTVTGTADFMGIQGLAVALTFAEQDGQVVATLTGTFEAGKLVQLPVVSWIKAGNLSFTTTLSQPYQIVGFRFHAEITVPGSAQGIPVDIVKLSGDAWQIEVAERMSRPATAEQLVALLGGEALASFLPQPLLEGLAGLQVVGVDAVFATGTKSISYFSTGVTITSGWKIAPRLSLKPGLTVLLTLVRPKDRYNRQTIGVVRGTFEVNKVDVPVFVQADVTPGSTAWKVGLDPASDGVTLPALSDLFAVAGGEEFRQSLPSSLRTLPQIQVSRLEADFTVSPGALTYLGFAATTRSPWTVIDGFLTVEELTLSLDLVDLTNPAARKVGGRLASTFSLSDDVWFFFAVEKRLDSDDWTLSGGLPPGRSFDLTSLVEKLIGQWVSVPAQAPHLVFNTATITVVPGKTMKFDAGSNTPWPLLPGRVEMETFTLAFTYDATNTAQRFTGSLETRFALGGVDVAVQAGLDKSGAFSFTGSTGEGQIIPVGALLADLGKRFGVTVPAFLATFELQNVFVAFNTGSGAFRYDCTGTFELLGKPVELNLTLDVKPAPAATALPAASGARPADATGAANPAQPTDAKKIEGPIAAAGAAKPAAVAPGTQASTPGGAAPAAKTAGAPAAPTSGAAPAAEKRDFELNVTGTLTIGDSSKFTLTFEKDPASTSFKAEWEAQSPQDALQFEDIAASFGLELPEVPEGLRLSLKKVSFTYDFTHKQLALTARSLNYGDVAFVADASGGRTRFLFRLALGTAIELTDLPIVGQAIPPELAFSIDAIVLWLSSAPVDREYAESLGRLLADGPALPAAGMGAGATLSVGLHLGEATHTVTLGTAPPPPPPPPLAAAAQGDVPAALQSATGTTAPAPTTKGPATAPAAAAPAAGAHAVATGAESTPPAAPTPMRRPTAKDGTSWLDLQKTLGPLSLERVGFRYRDGRITVLLDGGLSIAGFSFSLMGLQVSSALAPPLAVSLGLDGLGLEVARDPLLISGAFLRVPDPEMDWKYAGLVNVRIRELGLAAVGVYASRGGQASMFVFGSMDTPLGGPPAFFVTGLSGGLGFNSRVRVPGQDEVQDFPLVAGLSAAPRAPGEPPDPLAVLDRLQGTGTGRAPWITAEPGHVWIAAGVQFTSFKMVNTRALLLANLGERDLSFALLGLAEAQLPPSGGKLFAKVGLQLAAVLKPMEGFLGVTAVLTRDSWLLDPKCRLTGGFAFFLWFDGPHEGDFVLTVGGYHPSFPVPAHYPRVERLGFNWPVSDSVTLKGGTYFALTPSCVMAGVGLEASYSSGDLKAWFRASADFLAQWSPFHFEARIAVSVGASYRLHLLFTTVTPTVEIGAELLLWGPPTGGTVHVDWTVISFTIPFGEPRATRTATLKWPEFSQLLPPRDARLTLNLEGVQAGAGGEPLARPDDLSFTTRSAIPATELAVDTGARFVHQTMGPLSIRPMGMTNVTTPLTVQVKRDGVVVDLRADRWTVETVTQNHPEALWGAPLAGAAPAAPAAALLRDQLVGLRLRAPRAQAGPTPGAIDVERGLGSDAVDTRAPLPLDPDTQRGGPAPVADPDTVAAIAAEAGTDAAHAARAAAFAALAELGAAPAVAGGLAGVARDAALLYGAAPMRAA
jgi:hypothetical protein